MLADKLPRVPIAYLPTPLEPLRRLSAQLGGPELWIKRDDQTGLATGGNKARKLEFLVADALEQQADTLVTCGAGQSNHARQTAAAAARFGLACTLVLRGQEPPRVEGNLLLDRLLGARVVWAGEQPLAWALDEAAREIEKARGRPYIVPYGGSNHVGAAGYVAAMEELLAQCVARDLFFDYVVLASSSGGTQAGLEVGARALEYPGHILGISVDPKAIDLCLLLAEVASGVARHLGLDVRLETRVEPREGPEAILAHSDFAVDDGYLGGGYGVVGELEREAIRTLARSEGILLDPVYTGRAFGGLLDMIGRGVFEPGERVLFWHTGGTTGLFGYAEELV